MKTKNTESTQNKNLFLYKYLTFVLLITILCLAFTLYDECNTNDNLYNRIAQLEVRDSLNTQILESDSIVSYRIKNGEIVTYKQLAEELDSCKIELDVIKNNYPIQITRTRNTVSAKSAKIDSALLLLDLYRDKIEYDSKKNIWIVTK